MFIVSYSHEAWIVSTVDSIELWMRPFSFSLCMIFNKSYLSIEFCLYSATQRWVSSPGTKHICVDWSSFNWICLCSENGRLISTHLFYSHFTFPLPSCPLFFSFPPSTFPRLSQFKWVSGVLHRWFSARLSVISSLSNVWHANKKEWERTGEEEEGPAVEVEIYSGIEFTRFH